ncbi:unnamed protein product [Caenorhabditis angaria]|uniref:EF-hand domain-containing protein n=1 Tax=Caenorhabditis angaria TaxID=860376 RepID=A0A9P1IJ87_9PELO|nr:unnamed protein product [Caenorhabditis angaria]
MSSRIYPIPHYIIPRRCEETNRQQRDFNERILAIFEETRAGDFAELLKETEQFSILLKENSKDNFISMLKLHSILQKSAKCIKDMFPLDMVKMLIAMTNFNNTMDINLIEEIIKIYVHCENLYIKLLPYAENNKEISTYQLQEFITANYIPLMKKKPEKSEYYSAYIVGIMFFILDARRKDFALIQDLLTSTLFFHLESCILYENEETDEEPPIEFLSLRFFEKALREFRSLDVDRNGVLSESEMLVFGGSYFNSIFIKRIFEISQTYEKGSLDFKGFVDLISAIEFRHTRASAKYHFEAFDLKNDGVLDEQEIRELCLMLPECIPEEGVASPDVLVYEIMDMIKTKKFLTLEDVISSNMFPTFTGFVSNYNDWNRYEKREQ